MFNQFCYSCVRKSRSERKKFSHASKKLQWPLLDSVADTTVTMRPSYDKLNYFSKIGNLNKYPRDPHMLSLCSWKQEQCEGMGIVTLVVENIAKNLDIEPSKVSLIKVNTLESNGIEIGLNIFCL